MLFVSGNWEGGVERRREGRAPARAAAIHTTQVQIDEVTVIRLSPIVYNKELVKSYLTR